MIQIGESYPRPRIFDHHHSGAQEREVGERPVQRKRPRDRRYAGQPPAGWGDRHGDHARGQSNQGRHRGLCPRAHLRDAGAGREQREGISDTVLHSGHRYQVIRVEDWSLYGYWQAICTREEAA